MVNRTIHLGTSWGGVSDPPGPATWDSANKGGSIGLTGSDLIATQTGGTWGTVLTTTWKTHGKHYAEIKLTTSNLSNPALTLVGFCLNDQTLDNFMGFTGSAAWEREQGGSNGSGTGIFTYNDTASLADAADNDVWGFAIDADAGKGFVSLNGVFGGTQNVGTGANPDFSWTPSVSHLIYIGFSSLNSSIVTLQAASGSLTTSPPAGYTAWG